MIVLEIAPVCLPAAFTAGMGVLAWAYWQGSEWGDVWRLRQYENEIVALRCALASALAWAAFFAIA